MVGWWWGGLVLVEDRWMGGRMDGYRGGVTEGGLEQWTVL